MLDGLNELMARAPQWRLDPVECAYTLFVDDLTDQQKNIIRSTFKNRVTHVRSCHAGGKSFAAAITSLCFLFTYSPSKVVTFAPSWYQVKDILWSEINAIYRNAKITKEFGLSLGGTMNQTGLELGPDWFAVGLSPKVDKAEIDMGAGRVSGRHSPNMLIVLDEASIINPVIWSAVKTIMTGANSHLLAIGNPVVSDGPFYEGFTKPGVNGIKLDIFESPNFSANGIKSMVKVRQIATMPEEEKVSYLANLKNPYPALVDLRWVLDVLGEWGESSPLFQSRVLAEFPTKKGSGFIDLGDLEACAVLDETPKGARVLGVDPSRVKDRLVFFGLDNFAECYRRVSPGQDLMQTRNEILRVAREERFSVIAIEVGGLGIGLYDSLFEAITENNLKIALMPVSFAASPTPAHEKDCANLITELWLRLGQLVESHEIKLDDTDTLFAEIIHRTMGTNKKGLLAIEDKASYKKRANSQSPDIVDALLTALAAATIGNPGTHEVISFDRNTGGALKEKY